MGKQMVGEQIQMIYIPTHTYLPNIPSTYAYLSTDLVYIHVHAYIHSFCTNVSLIGYVPKIAGSGRRWVGI